MRAFLFISTLSLLTACSLYKSEGRKFLEKQSYQYAGVAARSTCTWEATQQLPNDQWVLLSEDDDARVFAHESDSFEVRVIPAEQVGTQNFSCLFKANAAQELFEMTPDAIAYTIIKYNEALL